MQIRLFKWPRGKNQLRSNLVNPLDNEDFTNEMGLQASYFSNVQKQCVIVLFCFQFFSIVLFSKSNIFRDTFYWNILYNMHVISLFLLNQHFYFSAFSRFYERYSSNSIILTLRQLLRLCLHYSYHTCLNWGPILRQNPTQYLERGRSRSGPAAMIVTTPTLFRNLRGENRFRRLVRNTTVMSCFTGSRN